MNVQSRQWLPLLTAAFFVLSASPVSAQKLPVTSAPIGLPQDWSHRHVVYTHPDTPEEAAKKGQTAKWRKNYRDPRFVIALGRRLEAQAAAKSPVKPLLPRLQPGRNKPSRPSVESGIQRDWSQVLGGSAGVGTPGVYPAKYSFDIYATPDCENDFVVYSTATAGATQVVNGTNNERRGLTITGDVGNGNTFTIGTVGTARSIVLTASATLNTGLNFQNITSVTVRATNLAAAANRWSHQTGITATSAAGVVTFRRNTFGNLATIALASTLTNATIGGNTNGLGTAGQPTIIAFNELYSSCNNDDPKQPRVFWSYNTGTGAIVETSPVLSYFDADGGGSQVAFVQRSGTTASLVLLRWSSAAPGTAGAPVVPTLAASAADYRNFATPGGCTTTPCMLVIPFADSNGNANHDSLDNRTSSPYVDYVGDVIWVGDADGFLHKFTGVFFGTPAEVDDATFPVEVSNGNDLTSPVYDSSTGQVFVGSASAGAGSGGMLHRVNATTGVVVSSSKLTTDTNLGILASPMIDSSAGRAYVFAYAGNGGTGANCTIAVCRAVVQFTTNFAAANTGTTAIVGAGADNAGQQYLGTFDDAYYSSPTPDGALYVAGGDPTQQWVTVLWKIPITNNVMGTPIRGATISGNDLTVGSYTSPLSQVKNGDNEYLYVGVHDYATDGTATVCGNNGAVGSACLYMFKLNDLNGTDPGTGDPWGAANVPYAGLAVSNGTGGIIMDNISAVPGTSQVYFSNLNSPGNAYQASQDELQ